jgi:hypothetical protein
MNADARLESFSVACSFVAGSNYHKGHRGHQGNPIGGLSFVSFGSLVVVHRRYEQVETALKPSRSAAQEKPPGSPPDDDKPKAPETPPDEPRPQPVRDPPDEEPDKGPYTVH